ncbi:formate dehydrogenase subunit alpha [Aquisalimonas lutea]|uniref:formate dehydrogenase subunit alpha n=1 Tax=Aquisalimonas lutea TaxID=1327750 RepID=UPI0025B60AF1|nr:formate dehydrogenase subunit alpha [Aquisalimonas lutea]MDN3519659.1 formate dehydrogenase subunit alpha [Aquisalimonas lutea]
MTDTNVSARVVESVCPYCGVGCALSWVVDTGRNRIVEARGRDGAANAGRLCVKGRYGFDYTTHAHRLTRPLIRREDAYPKGALSWDDRGPRRPGGPVDPETVLPHFREATWEEALERVAGSLAGIRDRDGGDALAGFGSAKGSNEEAYLFQKLVRAGFGTNNVDHCTRLCHASSVAALLEGIGSGGVTNIVRDIARADVALITGCNPTENHPVAATFMKQAAAGGTELLVVNTRRPAIADHAAMYVEIRPGTDVAFYNAMMHVIIREGLVDEAFIAERTEGYEALRDNVAAYPPEAVAELCGVSAERITEAARLFGRARAAMLFWGMGISQHTHGTDNARCLIALAMITGNTGRAGTGLHPLRGQNNVQGASDAGLIPMMYPDYQKVADPEARARFEAFWGRPLSPSPGRTVTEITDGALEGAIRGMYILGENPFVSDPDVEKVRKALARLDFLVVQDIFLTETAEFADVILPGSAFAEKTGTFTNTDRRVQVGRQALQPPGEARQDWHIIRDIAERMGLPMDYPDVAAVFDEFAGCTNSYASLSHAVLGSRGRWYPCPDPEHSEGEPIVFQETFPRGRALLVPAQPSPPVEPTDPEYPLVLNTGRVLEHWHTGTMTRRSRALHAISPEGFVEMHPDDAAAYGIGDRDWAAVTSRRGTIRVRARVDDRVARGSVFIPMHFREACANVLTHPAVDPYGKIPAFKYCAVRVERVAVEASA